jgi:hypothetical protein
MPPLHNYRKHHHGGVNEDEIATRAFTGGKHVLSCGHKLFAHLKMRENSHVCREFKHWKPKGL